MIIITIAKTLKFIKISEILNTGKLTKLSLKKSLTNPRVILSYILQKMPATSKDIQNSAMVEDFSICLIV